jgi:hypothetical protein
MDGIKKVAPHFPYSWAIGELHPNAIGKTENAIEMEKDIMEQNDDPYYDEVSLKDYTYSLQRGHPFAEAMITLYCTCDDYQKHKYDREEYSTLSEDFGLQTHTRPRPRLQQLIAPMFSSTSVSVESMSSWFEIEHNIMNRQLFYNDFIMTTTLFSAQFIWKEACRLNRMDTRHVLKLRDDYKPNVTEEAETILPASTTSENELFERIDPHVEFTEEEFPNFITLDMLANLSLTDDTHT